MERRHKVGVSLGTGSLMAALYSLDPERFITLLNGALEHQVVSFTFAFTLAAWIHSKQVRTEIKSQFGELVLGLDRLGEKLENRLEKVEDAVSKITERVDALESKE